MLMMLTKRFLNFDVPHRFFHANHDGEMLIDGIGKRRPFKSIEQTTEKSTINSVIRSLIAPWSRRASGCFSDGQRVAKRGACVATRARRHDGRGRPSVRNKELLHFTHTTRRRDYQSDISSLHSKWDSDSLKETDLRQSPAPLRATRENDIDKSRKLPCTYFENHYRR